MAGREPRATTEMTGQWWTFEQQRRSLGGSPQVMRWLIKTSSRSLGRVKPSEVRLVTHQHTRDTCSPTCPVLLWPNDEPGGDKINQVEVQGSPIL